MSLPPTDATTSMARTLVDEWVRCGLRDAVLAPGSRSAPLALALAADGRVRLSVFLDERSAAFFALGVAKATGRPALVLCTSGTAAANFHPAVVEAWHGRVPLVVCTADRPPELRDTGAGQTIDQIKLFGDAVRWFAEVGVPEDVPGAGRYWRSVAARSMASACGPPAGPVHLNLPFREPLVPTGAPLVDVPAREGGAPWTMSASRAPHPHPDDVWSLAGAIDAHPRGVLLAGWGAGVSPATANRFARAAGWPILADPISDLRSGPNAISTYDPLLRSPDPDRGLLAGLRPDFVLHVGAPPTNKPAREWLSGCRERVLVDPYGAWLDPDRDVCRRVTADPDTLLMAVTDHLCWRGPGSPWLEGWLAAEAHARRAVDDLIDSWEEPFEGGVLRDVARCLPEGSTIVVGSSMPVRDAESFVGPRYGLRWLANRGANGIDGFVSTVLGVAQAGGEDGPVVGVLGDLTLLHDVGGLLHAAERGIDAVLVVLDNDGGGIFSFLPQARLPEHFELAFGTPHGRDLVAVATAFGVPATRVTRAGDVEKAVLDAVAAGGVRTVVVPTDRGDNVTRHRQVWEAVAGTR
jgi:2-succinyl-5-enolpyruvyl-6-hydroxy-3-cyclohexene-1-carboxylate synthase